MRAGKVKTATAKEWVEAALRGALRERQARRRFADVAVNFPEQCRYVLETLGKVYKHDAVARERNLSPPRASTLPPKREWPADGDAQGLVHSAV